MAQDRRTARPKNLRCMNAFKSADTVPAPVDLYLSLDTTKITSANPLLKQHIIEKKNMKQPPGSLKQLIGMLCFSNVVATGGWDALVGE